MESGSAIRLITLAPELEGSDAVARLAAGHHITVAMGHSNASYDEAIGAADRGIRYAVHTFNCMRELSQRDPGIVGAVLSDDRIFAEVIADGIHVHPSILRIVGRSKGSDRILLATDAISATDMPDGRYVLGPDTVTVTNNVCRDSDGRLAGSTLTQELALKNYIGWTGIPMHDALLAVTRNPARALGFERKGALETGADADFVVIDADFHVMKTFVAGRLVFER
jgi:N-acetylglucosamine-6-phosphate deacetylase